MSALPFAVAAALAVPQEPPVTTIQVPPHVVVTGTLCTDVDGDGRDDLVLACRDPHTGKRELRRHHRRAEGRAFDNTPSLPPYPIEADVIAFTFADVTAAAGRELVLLTAGRAVAVEHAADGAASYHVVATPRLVWPAADPDFVLPLPDACRDVDGDGRDDLLLPEPDGAFLRHGTAPATPFALVLPPRRSPLAGRRQSGSGDQGPASVSGDALRLRLSFGDGDAAGGGGPLLALRATTPPCAVVDLDGDGRLDLAAVRNGSLFAALQPSAGTFVTREFLLPLPEDRLTLFDPSFDVRCADLGGDRRAELLVTTSARRDEAIEVRVDTFAAAADGGWETQATGRLRVQPLALPPRLVDADGDGALDLVLVTVRTDLLRALSGDGPTALDAQLAIFRGSGGRFAVPPVLQAALQLPVGDEGGRTPFVLVVPGAVLLVDTDGLQRRPISRDGERLQLQPATARCRLPQGARIEPLPPSADAVIVRGEHEVLWVDLR